MELTITSNNNILRGHKINMRKDGTFPKATCDLIIEALSSNHAINMSLSGVDGLPESIVRKIAEHLKLGQKILAIKVYRGITGDGLKEAYYHMSKYLPQGFPGRFTEKDYKAVAKKYLDENLKCGRCNNDRKSSGS